MGFFIILIYNIPCILYIFYYMVSKYLIFVKLYKNCIKIRNIPFIYWFFPFIAFNLFTFIFYILYLFFFFFFFFIKNFRYRKNLKRNLIKTYLKKYSIYFNFWRYLHLYIKKHIYMFFYIIKTFLFNSLKNCIKSSQLYFLLKYFFKYNYICIYLNLWDSIFLNVFLIKVWLKKQMFNIVNLDDLRFFYFIVSFWKKDLNYKYKEDPVLNRNKYLKYSNYIFKLYPSFNINDGYNINKNHFLNIKKWFLINFLFILNLIVLFFSKNKTIINCFIFLYKFLWKILINNFIKNFIFLIKYLFYFISIYFYIFILNLIYLIITISIYIFYYIIKYIYYIYCKNFYLIKWLIVLFIIIYFSWFINYYLIILYKHYSLYFPLFYVKNNFRIFNFDWVDLRNYYTLVAFRNNLIDISSFNNIFYNKILKELNFKLKPFGFKFSPKMNIILYSFNDYENFKKNQDNLLLNKFFSKYNDLKGYNFFKKAKRYKRFINFKFRHKFNNQQWFKSQLQIKKKHIGVALNVHRLKEELTQKKVNRADDHLMQLMEKWPLNKNLKDEYLKHNSWYRNFKRKNISTKKIRFYINKYIKLRDVPLKFIYVNYRLEDLNSYFTRLNFTTKENLNKSTYKNKFSQIALIFNNIYSFVKEITKQKFFDKNKKKFFFKMEYRKFLPFHKNFLLKNKIPTYLLTEQRRKRFGPLVNELKKRDLTSVSNVPLMSQYKIYQDISRSSEKMKLRYRFQWIFKKYPYRINTYNNIDYKHAIINYYNLLETGIKLTKKYYFFKNTRINKYNKLYLRWINSLDLIYFNQLKKYKYWKKPFFLNVLNENDVSFWGFFDHLKYRRYSHHFHYINGFFITHLKKDYYHMRVYLIRSLSYLNFYNNNKRITNPWKILSFVSDKSTWDNFRSFQYRWHFREYMFGHEKYNKNFNNIKYIALLFIKNFKKYYLEYFKINKYNMQYIKKVNSYKLKVLRKIQNINRFFYFKSKRSKGWKIFNYLNVFSIEFHIKHLLWHSPYSFWIFNNNQSYIEKNKLQIKFNELFFFDYIYKNKKHLYINASYYSTIFNLYLNVFEIKEDWVFAFYNDKKISKNLLNKSFFYFFNYGNKNYYNLNQLEGYRLLISLIKNYYDSFLLKLIRYRYLWDYKNLNSIIFIKRLLISIQNYLHLKWRITLYYSHDTYLKMIKRKLKRVLRKRFYIKYQHGFIPFWFVFDYYIKLFFKFLFKFYYIKENYCIWWLQYRLNYTFFFFFFLKLLSNYYYYKIYFINFNSFFYKLRIILYNINYKWIKIYNIFYNNYIIWIKYIINFYSFIKLEPFLYWYNNLIFYNDIYDFYINISKLQYYNIILIIKLSIYNLFFLFRKQIINFSNFYIDLKNFIFFKWNIGLSFKNYITMFSSIKNKLIYFKSNYYYFKYNNMMSRKKKRRTSHTLYNFLITKPKFHWNSLRIKSTAFYSYKKLSIFNLRSFFYIYNSYDMNLNITYLFSILFFPLAFFKNKIFDYNQIFYFFIIYIIFLLLTIFISKQFFKTIFIVRDYKNLHQFDWELFKKKNIFFFLKNSNNIKIELFKKVFLKNKIGHLNDLFYFLSPLKKNKKNIWWSGISLYNIFSNKLYKNAITRYSFDQYSNNLPYYNVNSNNLIFYNNKNTHTFLKFLKMYDLKFLSYFSYLNEFYMNYYFTIKKEKKEYKFHQWNLYFNFPFGFLYWILFVPYFFYAYILSKYHIRFSPAKRRRLYYLFKVLILDNLKIFIYLNKYLNRKFIRKFYRSKRPRIHDLAFWNRKRLKKTYTPKRHMWYRHLYIRLSGLGDFYFWFARINFLKYQISYKNYFFNSISKSCYFYWFYIFYILLLFYCIRKLINFRKNKINFIFPKIDYNIYNFLKKIKNFMVLLNKN